jgi:hypothetical protein
MPEPSLDSVHVDVPLSNLATAVVTDLKGFVALAVSPAFPTDHTTDSLWVLDVRAAFRADDNRQGPDGYLPEIRWKDSAESYKCVRHGLERFVSDVEDDNADDIVKPSRVAQRLLVERNMRALERITLSRMTDPANFIHVTAVPAGDRFNVIGSSVYSYVRTAMETPVVPPNSVLIGLETYNTIRGHAEIKEMYKYTGAGLVPETIIAEVLGVDNVFVSKAKYDNSDEAGTQSNEFIMGNDMLFFYLDPTPSRESLNTAWTFWYRGTAPVSPASRNPFYVKPSRDERRAGGGTYYSCEAWYDEANILNSQAAYLLTDVID